MLTLPDVFKLNRLNLSHCDADKSKIVASQKIKSDKCAGCQVRKIKFLITMTRKPLNFENGKLLNTRTPERSQFLAPTNGTFFDSNRNFFIK